MYFLICSNVYYDVSDLKFADSWKTKTSKYLENKTQFFPLLKKSYHRAILLQKNFFSKGNL